MNRRFALAIIICLIPHFAYASDFTPLRYLMLADIAFFLWPVVLPFFFLKISTNKFKMYFFLLAITYGVYGIVKLPRDTYNILSLWFGHPNVSFEFSIFYLEKGLAFLIALILIKSRETKLNEVIE